VLAAVLTGMGQDGARGAQRIVEMGGEVIVQDAVSCVVASMPNSTANAVTVDGRYDIERIGTELVSRVQRSVRGRDIRMNELRGTS
jgi:two-component system chemotaxis response regulator CheB